MSSSAIVALGLDSCLLKPAGPLRLPQRVRLSLGRVAVLVTPALRPRSGRPDPGEGRSLVVDARIAVLARAPFLAVLVVAAAVTAAGRLLA